MSNAAVQVCTRCIVDSTVPGARFNEKGECNFCDLHDKLEREYPLSETKQNVEKIIEAVKKSGKNSKYDCVCGVSGGRDSVYTLYVLKNLGLRILAVHFNDGFGNPVAGDNIRKAVKALDISLITITSDWRESKDLKLAFLKASVPDMEEGTDLGIATALYGVAARHNVKYVLIGQSFRTEGVMPLEWNYLDGKYLKSVHKKFGTVPLRPWTEQDPGFNLDMKQIFHYVVVKGIKTIPILYYMPYVRSEAEGIIKEKLGWVNPGAHYFDDLYQSLMTNVLRIKFNCDRRKINYSALVRSGQMTRERALEAVQQVYSIEDPKVIDLCIKRLGLTREDFDKLIAQPPKTFRDYPTSFPLIRLLRWPIYLLTKAGYLPSTAYAKYFDCA